MKNNLFLLPFLYFASLFTNVLLAGTEQNLQDITDIEKNIIKQYLYSSNHSKNSNSKDASIPGSRLFLDHKNGFRDMQFGASIEKLGETRNCKNKHTSSIFFGHKNKPLSCTRKRNYGSIVSIPIHDIEYIFHKINNIYNLTGINIYLFQSQKKYKEALTSSLKNRPDSASTDFEMLAESVQRDIQACKNNAERFTDVWGKYYMGRDSSYPSWSGKKVSAHLWGITCSILTIESTEMQRKGKELNDKNKKNSIVNEF